MTLIERLESAEQGSVKLDGMVWYHVVEAAGLGGKHDMDGRWPHYTTDLSAAVALVERVLPGWDWRVSPCRAIIDKDGVDPMYGGDGTSETEYSGYSAAPALALCIALLKALKPKEPSA